MKSVPFLDIHAGYVELRKEIDDAISSVLNGGSYILGDEVRRFELGWAEYCDVGYCLGVGNGYDALYLALLAAGVGEGDEVLVPSNTFIATWMAVHSVGATIVPVEPDPRTHVIDAGAVAPLISRRTRAIIPVHLYGHPVDLDPIRELAQNRSIVIIEDAAQAHGAKYRGSRIGGDSDMVAWSFYPGKNLGAFGDAGAVTTNSQEYASKLEYLRNYGSVAKYSSVFPGVNSRLDEVQAAVLSVKLRCLDDWNSRRAFVAENYTNVIQESATSGSVKKSSPRNLDASVKITSWPTVATWAESAWHLYVVRTTNRLGLAEFFHSAGISTGIHYPIPPHRQEAFKAFASRSLPIADELSRSVVSLPIGPHLSKGQMARVSEALAAIPIET